METNNNGRPAPEALISKFEITKLLKQGQTPAVMPNPFTSLHSALEEDDANSYFRPEWPPHRDARND